MQGITTSLTYDCRADRGVAPHTAAVRLENRHMSSGMHTHADGLARRQTRTASNTSSIDKDLLRDEWDCGQFG